MRKIIFILSLLIITKTNSQVKTSKNETFDIKWTPEITEKSTYNDQTVSTYSLQNGDIITVRTDDDFKHAEIARFDSAFKLKSSGSVDKDFKTEKEKFNVYSSTLVNSVPHLIGINIDKEENVTVGAFEIKQNSTIDLNGKLLNPFSAKDEKMKMKFAAYDGETLMNSKKPSLYFVKSKNNQFGLIASRIGNITQDNQKVIFIVVDNKFKEISRSEVLMPIKYVDFSFNSIIIANDGIPYAIVNNTKKYSKLELTSYLLKGGNSTIDYSEIKLDNDNVRSLKLFNESGNKIQLISTIVKEKKLGAELNKIIISEIEPGTNSSVNKNSIEINQDFLSKYKISPKIKFNNYVIRNIDFTSDGSYFLTLENFESVMETMTYGHVYTIKRGNITTTFDATSTKDLENKTYFNVLVLKFNSKNELLWSNIVEKEQLFASSSMVNYGGFKSIVTSDNNLALIYNDHKDNYAPNNKKITSVHSLINAVLVYKKVTENGLESTVIYDGKKESSNMKTPSFSLIDNNRMLMHGNEIVALGKTTKRSKYGLLTINSNQIDVKEIQVVNQQLKENIVSGNDKISSSKRSPSISNSSAIANGQSNSNSPAVARVLKYKADEKSVEYYNQLREKFEVEEKIRLEKEAADKIINAKKEEEARQARHLTDEQAPQFDKYRNGETNPVEKKTTVEEDYNKLFK